MVEMRRYGSHPSQHIEVWRPVDPDPRRAVVVIHGGWWRAKHDLHVMDGLCADLVARGWLVCNVEFRRIGGADGEWPVSLDDVLAAIDALADEPVPNGGGVIALGHSAGGHLALLAAHRRRLAGVVALAPVVDLPRCADERLGEDAVAAFIGGPYDDEYREAYVAASPNRQPPVSCPVLLVHGESDQRVPVAHSRDYVASVRRGGGDVGYVELPGVDHFAVIDPRSDAWRTTRERLQRW